MPVVVVPQAHASAISAVMAKAEVVDGRHAGDCSMDVQWTFRCSSILQPIVQSLGLRQARLDRIVKGRIVFKVFIDACIGPSFDPNLE
jgi:hypothetical protein